MSLADIVIITTLAIVVSVVVYFSFVRYKNNPCRGCPYYKKCDKDKCDRK